MDPLRAHRGRSASRRLCRGRDLSSRSQRPGASVQDQLQRGGWTPGPAQLPRGLRRAGRAPSVSAAGPSSAASGGFLPGSGLLSGRVGVFLIKQTKYRRKETST